MKIIKMMAAVAVLSLPMAASAVLIPSTQLLGTVEPMTPANPENETAAVSFLVTSFNAGGTGAVVYPGAGVNLGDNPADSNDELYTLWDPAGVGVLPTVSGTGTQTVTGNTTLNLGGVYDYILAKFGPDAVVFYIGNMSGEITIPNLVNTQGLSGYTLVNGRSVPDAGTTLVLLGGSLIGLGALRRRFSK